MPNPTMQELNQWWDGLQSALNDAKADIDLNNPRDRVRFRITEITEKAQNTYDAQVTAYFPFADNKNIDLNQVTDEQLLAMHKPGKPSVEKMTELYNAAREGRLFFASLPEREMQPRQLVVDSNGNAGVLPDQSHATPEVLMACNSLVKPEMPAKRHAGIGNRLAAFFGSKKAKRACKIVDDANARGLRTYHERMDEWNRMKTMDPAFVLQVQNGMYSMAGYFQYPDDDIYNREARLQTMATAAHKQPLVDAVTDMTNRFAADTAEKLSAMMKADATVTPEAQELIAQICYQKMLGAHIARELQQGTLTEDDITRSAHEAVSGSPEYRRNFAKTCGTEKFMDAVRKLSPDDVKAFAANPEAAAEAVYKKCNNIVRDTAFKQSAEAMKNAPAKQDTKDFTALSQRPQLEQVQGKQQAKEAPAPRL